MRIFPVRLPSGQRYWTVLDDDLDVMPAAARVVVAGPGAVPVRGARRINRVLVAVRLFLASAVTQREVSDSVLAALYNAAESRDLPEAAQRDGGGMVYRLAARHRLAETATTVDRASDSEIVALLRACRSARDLLIVLLMARVGLRRGEVVGLRREDVHLLAESRVLGCAVAGPHLHVVRRDNGTGAWAKSTRSRAAPVDFLVVEAFDLYAYERDCCPAAAEGDFLRRQEREPCGEGRRGQGRHCRRQRVGKPVAPAATPDKAREEMPANSCTSVLVVNHHRPGARGGGPRWRR